MAEHAKRLHDLVDILAAAAVTLQPLRLIELGIAAHVCHIVHLARIRRDPEQLPVRVRVQTVADGRRGAFEGDAGVGHAERFEGERRRRSEGGNAAPCSEVYDLFAVEVDDAEVGALGYFKGVTVPGGDDVRFGTLELLRRAKGGSRVASHFDG